MLTIGGGSKNMFFYVHPYLGKIPILTKYSADGLKPRTGLGSTKAMFRLKVKVLQHKKCSTQLAV